MLADIVPDDPAGALALGLILGVLLVLLVLWFNRKF